MKILPLSVAERLLGAIVAILLGLVAAILLYVISPREARAAPVLFDCADLAQGIASAADFRDAGADLEKTVRLARERSKENGITDDPRLDVFEREIRKLWAEKKRRGAAVRDVYKRCRDQLGNMGRES